MLYGTPEIDEIFDLAFKIKGRSDSDDLLADFLYNMVEIFKLNDIIGENDFEEIKMKNKTLYKLKPHWKLSSVTMALSDLYYLCRNSNFVYVEDLKHRKTTPISINRENIEYIRNQVKMMVSFDTYNIDYWIIMDLVLGALWTVAEEPLKIPYDLSIALDSILKDFHCNGKKTPISIDFDGFGNVNYDYYMGLNKKYMVDKNRKINEIDSKPLHRSLVKYNENKNVEKNKPYEFVKFQDVTRKLIKHNSLQKTGSKPYKVTTYRDNELNEMEEDFQYVNDYQSLLEFVSKHEIK
jgi:hypothetical protein